MAEIQPFKAIHYNTEVVKNLSKVVAPPYDVINKVQQEELFDRDPNNIIRLDLNPAADPYPEAAKELQRMLKVKALVVDSEPAIYPCLQTSLKDSSDKSRDGKTVTRRGFISWIKLEPFEAGVVLPHEHTLSGPKMDRLKLMTATKASFSQIFSLYGDPGKKLEKDYDRLAKTKPFLEADQDGVNNKIYRITDATTLKLFQDLFKNMPVYIADGHHRYETALEYQKQMKAKNPKHTGKEAYNYIMMYFTNIFDSGLVVYPTHRILHSIAGFDTNKMISEVKTHFDFVGKSDVHSLAASLLTAGDHAYGLILPEKKYYLMKLKSGSDVRSIVKENVPAPVKRLDVTLLHDYVLTQTLGISKEAQEKKLNINYTIDMHEVDAAVQAGKGQLGFILNPTKVEQVKEVADAKAVMPQKSTYFYPKLLSGLLLSGLE